MKKTVIFFCIFAIVSLGQTLAASKIKVVDGDSLEIGSRRIRLLGIDAPEYMQKCYDKEGLAYDCGLSAKDFLQGLVDKAQSEKHKIKCVPQDVDRYKRELCVCYAGDVNLNLQMVKSGWAVSYKSDVYNKVQRRAKERGVGIWQGKFMRPEFYRALAREREKEQQKEKNIVK